MHRKPDFFIVGGVKCGTSSLHAYLRAHPDIFMPDRKELQYFGTDVVAPPMITESEYSSYFESARDELRVGETSAWCLFSTRAPSEIYNFNPNAQILIMLRNPVDMLFSLHNELIRQGYEEIYDFEQALDAESLRRRGAAVPSTVSIHKILFYSEYTQYAQQIERYTNLFGPKKVLILYLENLKENPKLEYQRILQFLGVDTNFTPNFSVHNENAGIRSMKMVRLMRQVPKRLGWLYRPILTHQQGYKIKDFISSHNRQSKVDYQLDQALRERLENDLGPGVEKVLKIVGYIPGNWPNIG